jgi:RNA polymerase primary sigma factor
LATNAIPPEQRLLRDVFAGELSDEAINVLSSFETTPLRRHLRQQIGRALRHLSYIERGILEMCYGLGDGHAYTPDETALVFKISRGRILRLRTQALRKLHRHARDLRQLVFGLGR